MRLAAVALIGALILCSMGRVDRVWAAPLHGGGVAARIEQPMPREPVQYDPWGEQPSCWHAEGWHGSGWYQCVDPWQRGHGWGGNYGARGWEGPGWGSESYARPRDWSDRNHEQGLDGRGYGHSEWYRYNEDPGDRRGRGLGDGGWDR